MTVLRVFSVHGNMSTNIYGFARLREYVDKDSKLLQAYATLVV